MSTNPPPPATHTSKRSGGEQLTEELSEIRDCEAMLEERVKEWEKELIEKGETELLLRQLEWKFGEIPPKYRERIDDADSAQLLAWAKRILTAKTIDDVFGG